jgi:hypothetical protein
VVGDALVAVDAGLLAREQIALMRDRGAWRIRLSIGYSATSTLTGLANRCVDEKIYRKGRKVSERQFKELGLSAHDVCPLWNYTLSAHLNR